MEGKKEFPYSPDCVKRIVGLLNKTLLELYPNLAEIVLKAFDGKEDLSREEQNILGEALIDERVKNRIVGVYNKKVFFSHLSSNEDISVCQDYIQNMSKYLPKTTTGESIHILDKIHSPETLIDGTVVQSANLDLKLVAPVLLDRNRNIQKTKDDMIIHGIA